MRSARFGGRLPLVGHEITQLQRELKLEENTIVFFASDNGAMDKICGLDVAFFQSNGPHRGGKQEVYEGGIL